jgi:hypothetical protein
MRTLFSAYLKHDHILVGSRRTDLNKIIFFPESGIQ